MSYHYHRKQSLNSRLGQMHWGFLLLIFAVAGVGVMALYSAGNGSWQPWALDHLFRFLFGLFCMGVVACIDIRFWYRSSYILYGIGMLLLIYVEAMGHIGMGAQRWINLGFMKLQPSELIKIAVVMALARYFHYRPMRDISLKNLIIPAIMVFAPVILVMTQPDLGTGIMISAAGAAMFFIGGAPLWLFIGGIVSVLAFIPIAWQFLHEYQKKRVLIFLDPESDPLGAGYHITQSKIAIGSGGLTGKGYLNGTQSHLNFLPEKQTDFIFTLWSEEWGLIGSVAILILFGMMFFYMGYLAHQAKNFYARYLIFGLMINFSLYVFINTAMVMGLIPVVGAPLPLISYGGTAMLSAMIGFGLILSSTFYKDAKIGRG
jgi:rod shape determining protein RodA